MVSRLFLLYVVAELAVVVALASTIGLGWTLLLLLAAFAGGLAMAGSQLRVQMSRLFNGGGPAPAADSMAVALGTLLVVTPGLLTSVAGLLLLLPPTRAVARPLLSALAVRGLGRRIPLITVVGGTPYARTPRANYIDGEVIDVTEVDPPALGPNRPNA
ncbi:FxsA family protein [Candidatus Mycobacterium wuenschmannii]|uniref:FxsA family protein n=1 Tax=Candidatus Mycobacterium wuenschmannii TaxID=3027808 RepID=A0ABY8W3X8_9MYCO|nr:FxsA family protein [Candidatus Mycobacterium wuenschmannii]WIM89123.1 FxsA family protein [Candidatus Mycobacterium wuenschmannii]